MAKYALQVDAKHTKPRRTNLDIIADILFLCLKDRTKTSVLHKPNLNSSRLKANLNALTMQGLIAKKADRYITSEKGLCFLQVFAESNDLI